MESYKLMKATVLVCNKCKLPTWNKDLVELRICHHCGILPIEGGKPLPNLNRLEKLKCLIPPLMVTIIGAILMYVMFDYMFISETPAYFWLYPAGVLTAASLALVFPMALREKRYKKQKEFRQKEMSDNE